MKRQNSVILLKCFFETNFELRCGPALMTIFVGPVSVVAPRAQVIEH